MANIIRIRELIEELDVTILDATKIWLPVDYDYYNSNAKKINLHDVATYIRVDLSAQTYYQNSGATTATNLEGFPVGSTYAATQRTMQEMWDKLLYPVGFLSFSFNSPFIYEVGDTVVSKIAAWTNSNPQYVTLGATSIMISGDGIPIPIGVLPPNSSTTITFSPSLNRITVGTKGAWTIQGIDTFGATFTTQNSALNWYKRLYWGNSLDTYLTSFTGLTSSSTYLAASSISSAGYSFVGGGYKYFFFDTDQGIPAGFFDKLTNFGVAMETSWQVTINNAFSISCTYNVYRSTNILGGAIDIYTI